MNQTEKRESKKCILVVDDTAIVLTRILNILQEDYDVITVNSGVRALKYLHQEKPDLILLDIQMVPKDGIETLQDIRRVKAWADIPVIMLTGVEDKDIVIKAGKLGICGYVLKPFRPEDLLERIRRVFEQGGQTGQIEQKEQKGQKEQEGQAGEKEQKGQKEQKEQKEQEGKKEGKGAENMKSIAELISSGYFNS